MEKGWSVGSLRGRRSEEMTQLNRRDDKINRRGDPIEAVELKQEA